MHANCDQETAKRYAGSINAVSKSRRTSLQKSGAMTRRCQCRLDQTSFLPTASDFRAQTGIYSLLVTVSPRPSVRLRSPRSAPEPSARVTTFLSLTSQDKTQTHLAPFKFVCRSSVSPWAENQGSHQEVHWAWAFWPAFCYPVAAASNLASTLRRGGCHFLW